jgi:hypothetical protein
MDSDPARPRSSNGSYKVSNDVITCGDQIPIESHFVKYWEIIADNLSKAGWSYGYVSAIDSDGRTIWIADAHRGNGKRFVVHADEKLAAFVELERAIRETLRKVYAVGDLSRMNSIGVKK